MGQVSLTFPSFLWHHSRGYPTGRLSTGPGLTCPDTAPVLGQAGSCRCRRGLAREGEGCWSSSLLSQSSDLLLLAESAGEHTYPGADLQPFLLEARSPQRREGGNEPHLSVTALANNFNPPPKCRASPGADFPSEGPGSESREGHGDADVGRGSPSCRASAT